MPYIVIPELSDSEWTEQDKDTFPEVAGKFGRGLSYLVGYDETNQVFRMVRTDEDGRIIISDTGASPDSLTTETLTLSTTPASLVANNDDRSLLMLRNVGSDSIFIGNSGLVGGGDGWEIGVGEVLTLEGYTGDVFGYCASGSQDLSVLRDS